MKRRNNTRWRGPNQNSNQKVINLKDGIPKRFLIRLVLIKGTGPSLVTGELTEEVQ